MSTNKRTSTKNKEEKYVVKCGHLYVRLADGNIPMLVEIYEATEFSNKEDADELAERMKLLYTGSLGYTPPISSVYYNAETNEFMNRIMVHQENIISNSDDDEDESDLISIENVSLGQIYKIGGTEWRVIDRKETNDDVKLAFMTHYIYGDRVPYALQCWVFDEKHQTKFPNLYDPDKASYKTSFVRRLCIEIEGIMKDALRFDRNNMAPIIDQETCDWIHLLTYNQVMSEFDYFYRYKYHNMSVKRRYWLATLSTRRHPSNRQEAYVMDFDGRITTKDITHSVDMGVMFCFSIRFPKYNSFVQTRPIQKERNDRKTANSIRER